MERLHTQAQAESWFLSHHSGSVIVVNAAGEAKEVDCYPDAVAHINS